MEHLFQTGLQCFSHILTLICDTFLQSNNNLLIDWSTDVFIALFIMIEAKHTSTRHGPVSLGIPNICPQDRFSQEDGLHYFHVGHRSLATLYSSHQARTAQAITAGPCSALNSIYFSIFVGSINPGCNKHVVPQNLRPWGLTNQTSVEFFLHYTISLINQPQCGSWSISKQCSSSYFSLA